MRPKAGLRWQPMMLRSSRSLIFGPRREPVVAEVVEGLSVDHGDLSTGANVIDFKLVATEGLLRILSALIDLTPPFAGVIELSS